MQEVTKVTGTGWAPGTKFIGDDQRVYEVQPDGSWKKILPGLR